MATVTYTLPDKAFFLQKKPNDGDPISYSAADFRRFSVIAASRRPGILGWADFKVKQAATVGWRVTISYGYCHVQAPGAGLGAGNYLVYLPQDVTIDLTGFTTSPQPSPHVHKVWVVVYDALTAGSGYDAQIIITEDTTGTGAPTPTGAVAFLQIGSVTTGRSGQVNVQQSDIGNVFTHGGTASANFDITALLASGFQADTSALISGAADNVPRLHYDNGRVHLAGGIIRSGTTNLDFTAGADYTIATMYRWLRPRQTRVMACPGVLIPVAGGTKTYQTWLLQIDNDGTMTAHMPKAGPTTVLYLDGVSYDLDYATGVLTNG